MFWKMLKSDLKQKKGLSIVLFLFITVASVLVFVGGVQIYQFFTGSERNDTACKSSDMIVYNPRTGPKKDDFKRYVEKAIDHNPNVAGKYKREVRRISSDCVDFPAIDEYCLIPSENGIDKIPFRLLPVTLILQAYQTIIMFM